MELALQAQGSINSLISAINLSRSYLNRHNIAKELCLALINSIKATLTLNKKLKIAKYRVNTLKYQMYKMDKLITENNPYNFVSGGRLNTFN